MKIPIGKGTRKGARLCSSKIDQLEQRAFKIRSKLVNQKWFLWPNSPLTFLPKANFHFLFLPICKTFTWKAKKQKEKGFERWWKLEKQRGDKITSITSFFLRAKKEKKSILLQGEHFSPFSILFSFLTLK